MPIAADESFTYRGGAVEPGETANIRYTVSETYLGDPIRIPVTIINGTESGPIACLTAASHGDELNGIEVVRTVAHDWEHEALHGAIVCLPVLNVAGFLAQQRYLPVLDRDLNRSFPGRENGTSADRIALSIFRNFIEPCDFVLDFHTSTRGRNNFMHVRADLSDTGVSRVARSFASHVIIDSAGPDGSLRYESTEAGVPGITIEMGEAHRFQRNLIDTALESVKSVFAEFGLHDQRAVMWPGWRTIIDGNKEKTWIRADAGGIVDMHYRGGELVEEGAVVCTISNPFKADREEVNAPFTGLVIGVLQNPVVYPGNPLCHLVKLGESTQRVVKSDG